MFHAHVRTKEEVSVVRILGEQHAFRFVEFWSRLYSWLDPRHYWRGKTKLSKFLLFGRAVFEEQLKLVLFFD
jgi:hypothetical protein